MTWNKWKIIPAALLMGALTWHFCAKANPHEALQGIENLLLLAACLSMLTVIALEKRNRWTWIGLIFLTGGWIWVAYESVLTLTNLRS